jgi:methylated-DNA-[protein]-cysteine S-methyltransferase
MPQSEETIRQALRAHGLRSTPQRHAILKAFERQAGEHLSAEEIHDRASRSLNSLSRGTVYAALAELTELGLLSAVGLPEPVRYELNTARHDHFRCRLCLRLFDLAESSETSVAGPSRAIVERIDVRAEGICGDCVDYEAALRRGARSIKHDAAATPWGDVLQRAEVACAATDGPLGTILLAASPAGVLRLAFDDHFDAQALQARAASRRGARDARRHLHETAYSLERFFAGECHAIDCAIDSSGLADAAPALEATRSIPYAGHASYTQLAGGMAPRELGLWMGANPLPIIFPCHRVSRGRQVPDVFVGGLERRRWLEEHEREHAPTATRP